jgi:4-hydroxybenzoate polyprenyltransferase
VFLGLMIQDLALIGLTAAAIQGWQHSIHAGPRPLIPPEGMLVLALVALATNTAAARAIRDPIPSIIQRAVKTGILALVWIDAGLVAAVRGPQMGWAIASLWVPAYLLGRWIYST